MLNTVNIVRLLVALVGVALLFVGLSVIMGSKRAQYSETARTSVNALAGIMLVALGLGRSRWWRSVRRSSARCSTSTAEIGAGDTDG